MKPHRYEMKGLWLVLSTIFFLSIEWSLGSENTTLTPSFTTHVPSTTHVPTTHVPSICSRCQCMNMKPFTVDCNNMKLKEVPEFWKDLRVSWRFSINGNLLVEVPVFPFLGNLTSLTFRYNKISKIAESAFYNLTSLKSIDLSHNEITAESLNAEIFKGPYVDKIPDPIPLEELDLSHNKLTRLPKEVFYHLKYLKVLSLSHNEFVDLSSNTAQAISEIQSLTKLDLSYTKLLRLPNHFFAELINLAELDLSGNDFVTVPSEVNYARSLEILSLNDNVFGLIAESTFWENSGIKTLSLKGSKTLFRIENGAFGNLTSLETLWLNENTQLSTIYPLAFANKLNRTLHLKELHLENNRLEGLPEYGLPWKDIRYLNLQGNPWNCDCNFEWLAKDVMPIIKHNNFDLSVHVTCAAPRELMGYRVTDEKVQSHEFVCTNYRFNAQRYGFVVVSTIVVGILLLVTGSIIFAYVLFKRNKIHDWVGENVKYRRTMNEDEDAITSNIQY